MKLYLSDAVPIGRLIALSSRRKRRYFEAQYCLYDYFRKDSRDNRGQRLSVNVVKNQAAECASTLDRKKWERSKAHRTGLTRGKAVPSSSKYANSRRSLRNTRKRGRARWTIFWPGSFVMPATEKPAKKSEGSSNRRALLCVRFSFETPSIAQLLYFS